MEFDSTGNLYIADFSNHAIRKVDTGGTITTVAGTGAGGFSGDGGAATSAQLNLPTGLAFDSAGNMYIADFSNQRIRKVDTGGTITAVAGTGAAGFSGDGGPATSAQFNNPLAQIHRRDDYAAAERAIGAREGDGPGTIWGREGPVFVFSCRGETL